MGLNDLNKINVHPLNEAECHRAGGTESGCFSSTELSEEIRPNEVPAIVPCYNGKTLKIHEELVLNGLCAISIKHHNGNCKEDRRGSEDFTRPKPNKIQSSENKENDFRSVGLRDFRSKDFPRTNGDVPECMKDKMKRRNSFWNVHRPELSKLTWPENFVSSAVLQDFFHNHLRIHGTFCEPLHECTNRTSVLDEEFRDYSKLREIVPPRILPPDEKIVNIMEKGRSVQLNDEDLDPETQVHKSRAEFCVTIGEYVRRPPLKRTTSQVMPKCVVQATNRFDSLSTQHEGFRSKDTMMSEERISAVIGSTDFYMNQSMSKHSKKLNSGLVMKSTSLQRMIPASPSSLNNVHFPVSRMKMDEKNKDSNRSRMLRSSGETSTHDGGYKRH